MSRRLTFVFLLSFLAGCAGQRIRSARDVVRITEDIPYLPGSEEPKHRLDLYVPRNTSSFPVVLFVHGGFWTNQDRRYYQAFSGIYGNLGVALAKRGIGVAVQSYRLNPAVGIEDQLSDVLAALRWVQSNMDAQGGDTKRLVLAGYSAGGHLVSLLGLDPRYMQRAGIEPRTIRGYVSISGVLDIPAMAAQQDASFNRDVSYRLFGRTPEEQARMSPTSFVRADAPPMLLLAAQHDYPFVLSAARETATRLTALGAHATFHEIAGYDHADMVVNVNTSDDRVSDLVAGFVREVTAPPEPAPPAAQ